jgi:hypothetical protein
MSCEMERVVRRSVDRVVKKIRIGSLPYINVACFPGSQAELLQIRRSQVWCPHCNTQLGVCLILKPRPDANSGNT